MVPERFFFYFPFLCFVLSLFIIRYSTFDIRHSTFDIGHWTFDIRRSTFDIRHFWALPSARAFRGARHLAAIPNAISHFPHVRLSISTQHYQSNSKRTTYYYRSTSTFNIRCSTFVVQHFLLFPFFFDF